MAKLRLKIKAMDRGRQKGTIISAKGRAEILETIERQGRLTRRQIMRMSYKGVWSKIKVTEDLSQR